MTSRKLTLRREALTELTTGELGSVAGASGLTCDILAITRLCPTYQCTGEYSLDIC